MRALTLLWLMPAFVSAQSDPASQWEAPPTSPKPAPAPSGPAVEQRDLAAATVEARSPEPRRFAWGHAALALMGAAGQSGYFAVRVEGGAVLGWPVRMAGTPDRARGVTLGLGLDALAAKVFVAACGGAGLCGSRYQAGVAVRGAYNWGVIGPEGVVAPVHEVFVQAVPFVSSNWVPSAPLLPGALWGEHGVRFDVGMTSAFWRGSSWPRPGASVFGGGLYFALSLEWLIVNSDQTGLFRFGVSAGVGF